MDLHGNAKKAWMIFFLFKEFLSFFKKFVLGGVSFNNRHLLVLDGHGNHVTLKAISQAQEMGLNMITLKSCTSDVFHVSYFKPFNTTFGKVKDSTMSRNNHMELNKITLVGWVDQALEQSLTKKNLI
jgi:hypothetical protein